MILQGNNTALTFACLVNDLSMVSILLKAGAHPNTCNKVESHELSSLQSGFLNPVWTDSSTDGCEE